MTLQEKVRQLFMVGFEGVDASPALLERIRHLRPGGLILFAHNLESPDQILRMINTLQTQANYGPMVIAIDQEGGRVSRLPSSFTRFPSCGEIGRFDSPDLAYQVAAATATELRAVGITMNLAPVLDLDTNPLNPIIGDRAFGRQPERVRVLGGATIAGFQEHGVIACGKHFPGHGDTGTDSHLELPTVPHSQSRLEEIELDPFRHAIAAGVASLMTAHVVYPAWDERRPATLSPAILTDLLRQRLGFEGLIVTDDLEMRAILDHHSIEEAAVQALRAGADLLLIGHDASLQDRAILAVQEATRTGAIAETRVDQAFARLSAVRQRFLFPYQPADGSRAREVIACPSHRSILARIQQALAGRGTR